MSSELQKPVVGEIKGGPRLFTYISNFFSKPAKKLNLSKLPKAVKVLIPLILLVLILGSGIALYRNYKKPVIACDNNVIEKATLIIDRGSAQDLKPIVSNIQKNVKYTKDPNCLYIVTEFYVKSSDYKNAQVAFSNLEKTYNPKKGFNSHLDTTSTTMKDLKHEIDLLKELSQPQPKPAVNPWGAPL